MESPEYDDGTKEMIAYALGEMKYKDEESKKAAALGLYKLVTNRFNKFDLVNQAGHVYRYRLETALALAKLGYTQIDGKDVISGIVCSLGGLTKHPEARLVAAWALGLLGTNPHTSQKDQKRILQDLSNFVGDKLNGVVAKGAYSWYQKVHSRAYPPS